MMVKELAGLFVEIWPEMNNQKKMDTLLIPYSEMIGKAEAIQKVCVLALICQRKITWTKKIWKNTWDENSEIPLDNRILLFNCHRVCLHRYPKRSTVRRTGEICVYSGKLGALSLSVEGWMHDGNHVIHLIIPFLQVSGQSGIYFYWRGPAFLCHCDADQYWHHPPFHLWVRIIDWKGSTSTGEFWHDGEPGRIFDPALEIPCIAQMTEDRSADIGHTGFPPVYSRVSESHRIINCPECNALRNVPLPGQRILWHKSQHERCETGLKDKAF